MPRRPRILRLDLGDLEPPGRRARPAEPWRGTDPAVDRIGTWSGSALALSILYECELAGASPPFVLAVGECVRRGLSTAARTSVVSRAPLTGRLADGT